MQIQEITVTCGRTIPVIDDTPSHTISVTLRAAINPDEPVGNAYALLLDEILVMLDNAEAAIAEDYTEETVSITDDGLSLIGEQPTTIYHVTPVTALEQS